MQRTHFPDFSVQEVLRKLRTLITFSKSASKVLLERIGKCFDTRRRVFVICNKYLISREVKKGYRAEYFRDAVIKKVRLGHNGVDTIIASGGLEMTVDFSIQSKNGNVSKIRRARQPLLSALAFLQRQRTPKTRIRVLFNGGDTNETFLPPLREWRLKYTGTVNRKKHYNVFGTNHHGEDLFKTEPEKLLTIDGKMYHYAVNTLNLTRGRRHRVVRVRRGYRSDTRFYLTNDLKMTPATFFRCQRDRWWIKQQYRDLKQFYGLKHLFCKKKKVSGRKNNYKLSHKKSYRSTAS